MCDPSIPLDIFKFQVVQKVRKKVYSSYIYKGKLLSVLKQVHPDTGISNKLMAILNSFVTDIFERIATEASGKLHLAIVRFDLLSDTFLFVCRACHFKKSTISSRENQTSVQLIHPGELAKNAIFEGTKSVRSTLYQCYHTILLIISFRILVCACKINLNVGHSSHVRSVDSTRHLQVSRSKPAKGITIPPAQLSHRKCRG